MRKTALLVILCLSLVAGAFTSSAEERLAYVPNEGDNNVVVVDLIAEKVIKTLPTGKTPHALAFTKDGKCYVNNRGTKDLTVIDANRLEVIKTIALPATSFQLALSPDGKTLAVAYKDALKVSLIDTGTDNIMKTIPVGKEPEGAFKGAMMRHSYWSKDGRFLYASDDFNYNIVKIDVADFEIKAAIALPGSNHYIHPSPDGKVLYAVNETTKTGTSVTLINSDTDKIISDIPIPLEPGEKGLGHHGVFTKDGNYFFVCNEGGRTVTVIDTAKMEVVKTLKVGMGAGHPSMSRDGKYIFVIHHNDNIVAVIDTAKQEVVKNILVGNGKKQAHGSYFTPDGKYFYMINAEDNIMNKIDVAKMEVVSKIPVGKSAMYFGMKEGKEFPSTE
ncbi:MAG TPA: cytochrome D1 domain-containing protein [Thermodesulfovibrionales bacterium]|nr:cytochrome D1 domain-containing protein [Thermodesulfovibrionales bacterium]